MRGDERVQDGMFSYVLLEQRVSPDHPLRAVQKLTDAVLRTLSPEFDALYAESGRPSNSLLALRSGLQMPAFYNLTWPDSERLAADFGKALGEKEMGLSGIPRPLRVSVDEPPLPRSLARPAR
jgi:hypothetical protein